MACGGESSESCGDEPAACTCADGSDGIETCVDGEVTGCSCEAVSCSEDSDCGGDEVCSDGTCVPDSDGDGVADPSDNCPDTANPDQEDLDMNGVGNACQIGGDLDGDGVEDSADNCPADSNPEQQDADDDAIGDVCDDDRDGDGVANDQDNCPDYTNDRQTDANGDGVGNACDTDEDAVLDVVDNCVGVFNPDQDNLDDDDLGDACDDDRDGDGIVDANDSCPFDANPEQTDTDDDSEGDACDEDDDGDTVSDADDNCPLVANSEQEDRNQNGMGDVCDDPDMDGVPDSQDNCPDEANPLQEELDTDSDGLTDCVERRFGSSPTDADTDGDGLNDADELSRMTDPTVADTDGDGLSDAEEVSYRLDPNQTSTFNDGISDSMRPFLLACGTSSPTTTTSYTSTPGNWTMTFPSTFTNYTELAISTANSTNGFAAGTFQNSSGTVAGFVYAERSNQSRDLYAEMEAILGRAPEYTHSFTTHDGYPALTHRRAEVLGASQPLAAFRDVLLFRRAGFSASEVANMPTPSGNVGTRALGQITVVNRSNQLVVLAALSFDPIGNRSEIEDSTNTSGMSAASASASSNCARFGPYDEFPGTDVYWQVDQAEFWFDTPMLDGLTNFFSSLNNTNVTARFAVASMAASLNGRVRTNPGWVTTEAALRSEARYYETGPFIREEYSFLSAEAGITWLQNSAPAAMRPRSDAELIYVAISDEDAATFHSLTAGSTQFNNEVTRYRAFFGQYAPFYGLIPVSDCTPRGSGPGYIAVAKRAGGFFADLCGPEFPGTGDIFLEELAEVIASRGSAYELPNRPISSSINVLVGGTSITRGGRNGWEYYVETNSIVMRGSAIPSLNDPAVGAPGEGVTITYQVAP